MAGWESSKSGASEAVDERGERGHEKQGDALFFRAAMLSSCLTRHPSIAHIDVSMQRAASSGDVSKNLIAAMQSGIELKQGKTMAAKRKAVRKPKMDPQMGSAMARRSLK
ncbi:MAG: hypothetical protein A3I01_20475 [Betaproteobacteria bacterium RIFCSPLOWO2_02_FULL_65_24]|nr:MAG: hypothetical protein A3I01_20475 [Betaproteobacteria bacterium RIFCSPLOWO2_02_FULL_65_24]OGA80197.1 MAG: hypothetical protein A3G27_20275 [Betaproteobacteria bacterium RIFCSPLOWO2_12_FULL_66_14]